MSDRRDGAAAGTWLIAAHEMNELFRTFRFHACALLVVLSFLASGVLFLARYSSLTADYEEQERRNERRRTRNVETSRAHSISFTHMWPPSIGMLFADGGRDALPNKVTANASRMVAFKRLLGNEEMLRSGTLVDWALVLGLIVSFSAGALSFDTISREKRRGTLALMLASGIPRSSIFLGKYLGLTLLTAIPILLGGALSLYIVVSSELVEMTPSLAGLAGLVLLMGWLHTSLFVLLGVGSSALASSGTSSAIAFLNVWLILAVVLPNCGAYLYQAPGRRWADVVDQARQEVVQVRAATKADGTEFNRRLDMTDEILHEALMEHLRRLLRGVERVRHLMSISPRSALQTGLEAVSGTGVAGWMGFVMDVDRHRQTLRDHFDRVDSAPRRTSDRGYSMRDVPRFSRSEDSTVSRVPSAAVPLLLLVIENVALFLGGYLVFIRMEVAPLAE